MFSLWLWYAPGAFLIKFRELHVEHTTRIHLAYTQLTYLSYNSLRVKCQFRPTELSSSKFYFLKKPSCLRLCAFAL